MGCALRCLSRLKRLGNVSRMQTIFYYVVLGNSFRMVAFQRKTDAVCIALVFDVRGCDSYKGHGYHHPDTVKEPPKGLDSFPAVICYPGVCIIIWNYYVSEKLYAKTSRKAAAIAASVEWP